MKLSGHKASLNGRRGIFAAFSSFGAAASSLQPTAKSHRATVRPYGDKRDYIRFGRISPR